MKNISSSVVIGAALTLLWSSALASPASAQASANPAGIWAAKDGSVTVNIAPCQDKEVYCATVIEEKLEEGEKSQIGQTVMQDLKFDKKKGWRAVFLADGGSYKANAKFRSESEIAFKICAFAFVCDTQVFLKK